MSVQPGDILVEEILSEESKKTKDKLLLICTLSFGIVKGELVPNSISAFGINLTNIDKKYLIFSLILICTYFWVSLFRKTGKHYWKSLGNPLEY